MRRFTVLGTTPRDEPSLGITWEKEECQALQQQIERAIGGPPSGATFDIISIQFLSGPQHTTSIALGIWYQPNDPESVSYLAEAEGVMEEKVTWEFLSLKTLGPAYDNLRKLFNVPSQQRSRRKRTRAGR
jgi:hypothetical protein